MPVYDYRCLDCNSTYDVYHKVREVQEDILCPSCGSRNHKKLMSVTQMSMGSGSTSDFSSPSAPSCESGSCCGGSCGLN